jgi:hypothetical protein
LVGEARVGPRERSQGLRASFLCYHRSSITIPEVSLGAQAVQRSEVTVCPADQDGLAREGLQTERLGHEGHC